MNRRTQRRMAISRRLLNRRTPAAPHLGAGAPAVLKPPAGSGGDSRPLRGEELEDLNAHDVERLRKKP